MDTELALHTNGLLWTHRRKKARLTPRLRQLVDGGIALAMSADAFRAASFYAWVGISWMRCCKSSSGSEVLAKVSHPRAATERTVPAQVSQSSTGDDLRAGRKPKARRAVAASWLAVPE
jgi:predicted amidohydrolase YtcJ